MSVLWVPAKRFFIVVLTDNSWNGVEVDAINRYQRIVDPLQLEMDKDFSRKRYQLNNNFNFNIGER